MTSLRKRISICLNFLVSAFSFSGVALACIFATRDGYSHWYKRLLYFTQLSNIWIGAICLLIGIISIVQIAKKQRLIRNYMYVLKFIFTVSITITGIVFCGLLAPFADFKVWTFSSVLTHVVVPVLAITDYFVNDEQMPLKRYHIFLSIIPPFLYLIFAMLLSALRVDFGRGDTFAYFFMDFYSDVGFFGFKNDGALPEIGNFYWIAVISLLIFGLSWLYYALHSSTRRLRKNKKSKVKLAER